MAALQQSKKSILGATSIEFCLVFILLFLVFYGAAGYTLPLLLSATYQEIAAKSVREAVQLQTDPTADIDPESRVREIIARSRLAGSRAQPCAGYANRFLQTSGDVWKVCLHTDPDTLIPTITLINWQVPALPEDIRAEATLQVR